MPKKNVLAQMILIKVIASYGLKYSYASDYIIGSRGNESDVFPYTEDDEGLLIE